MTEKGTDCVFQFTEDLQVELQQYQKQHPMRNFTGIIDPFKPFDKN